MKRAQAKLKRNHPSVQGVELPLFVSLPSQPSHRGLFTHPLTSSSPTQTYPRTYIPAPTHGKAQGEEKREQWAEKIKRRWKLNTFPPRARSSFRSQVPLILSILAVIRESAHGPTAQSIATSDRPGFPLLQQRPPFARSPSSGCS